MNRLPRALHARQFSPQLRHLFYILKPRALQVLKRAVQVDVLDDFSTAFRGGGITTEPSQFWPICIGTAICIGHT